MAYIDQGTKKKLAPAIKAVLKKYGMKGTIAIRHHSKLVVNLSEGPLDLIEMANKSKREAAERHGWDFSGVGSYFEINTHHPEHLGDETGVAFARELIAAMKGNEWFDRSDIQTDYFNTAYYLDIHVGRYGKPYRVVR